MALSQLFRDVLLSSNLKLPYLFLKIVHFISLNMWYVSYFLLWIKYGFEICKSLYPVFVLYFTQRPNFLGIGVVITNSTKSLKLLAMCAVCVCRGTSWLPHLSMRGLVELRARMLRMCCSKESSANPRRGELAKSIPDWEQSRGGEGGRMEFLKTYTRVCTNT